MADQHHRAVVPLCKPAQPVQHGAHLVGLVHLHPRAEVALYRVKNHQLGRHQQRRRLNAGIVQRQAGRTLVKALDGHPRLVGTQRLQPGLQHDGGVVLLREVVDRAGLLRPKTVADPRRPVQRQPRFAHARHAAQHGQHPLGQIGRDEVLGLFGRHVRDELQHGHSGLLAALVGVDGLGKERGVGFIHTTVGFVPAGDFLGGFTGALADAFHHAEPLADLVRAAAVHAEQVRLGRQQPAGLLQNQPFFKFFQRNPGLWGLVLFAHRTSLL